jgi:D-alanine-D-alanine ligase
MRVGVVHTVGSSCRCAESVASGLEALGHEALLVDSEEIELRAFDLAEQCDLVIDHTDTYRGLGLLRPLVRLQLEAKGARVVGSDAKACMLADDKAAAKACLCSAGIPTVPGIVVTSPSWESPSWLGPPFVLKPAFEHMSRGLAVAGSLEEARGAVIDLLAQTHQPVLVERLVPGRELAVSVLEGPQGLELLPVLEWRLGEGESGVLGEAIKQTVILGERRDVQRAQLPAKLQDELDAVARGAFRALGLRDYARFDIRLSRDGLLYLLEANTTPSLEPQEALALSARWAGLEYPALVDRLLSSAVRRYDARAGRAERAVRIDLPTGPLYLDVPEGVHSPAESSVELARLLDVQPGEDVLELGCGTGLLSLAAAKLGARRVVATDVDPRALAAIAGNARRNGLEGRIQTCIGSWYKALESPLHPPGAKRFHVIIATPPQTPGHRPFGRRYGGAEGTEHIFAVLKKASAFLEPSRGRLWLLAISLANPKALWERLDQRFSQVSLVRETERVFAPEEYQAMGRGLFEHLMALRSAGCAQFRELDGGCYAFRNLFIRAARPRRP